MGVYGWGLVGLCMFLGSIIGRSLGLLIGIDGDIGGVGFAMLMLIFLINYLEKKDIHLHDKTKEGIKFLSALYIPIVVAMASIQDVVGALSGGMVAIIAGALATLLSLLLVPVLSKLTTKK